METIEAGGITYRVTRSSRRRTVCIRIGGDGVPEILAPTYLPREELARYAAEYAAQVSSMREKKLAQLASQAAFTLDYGDALRVLGGTRILTARPGNLITWDDARYYVPPGLAGDALRQAAVQLYKLHAKAYLTPRVIEISGRMGLHPLAVKVNAATSHWASCSARDTLNFSWYTMMARESAVEYIIIHELCHMRHFDHSPAFWAEVARWCPGYAAEKAYLAGLWREISAERWK